MDRAADLRADYDRLGVLLESCEPNVAAAIVRERRMISELLEKLERTAEVPLVDQLAERRTSRSSDSRKTPGRSKSG